MCFTTLVSVLCRKRAKCETKDQLVSDIGVPVLKPTTPKAVVLATGEQHPPKHPRGLRRRSNTSPALGRVLAESAQPECEPACIPRHQCRNRIRISGDFAQVKAARKTLKKYGFLDRCQDENFPLNGHWETCHGMIVVIEGKMVRWSQKRASRLKFTGSCKNTCLLDIYGEATTGKLELAIEPGAAKVLKWANGDIWHSLKGCRIGQAVLLSQTMTKVQRDKARDEAVRAEASAQLKLVSRSGLSLLPDCIQQVAQFIGSTTYHVDVHFNTENSPARTAARDVGKDLSASLSKQYPAIELHHYWEEAAENDFATCNAN